MANILIVDDERELGRVLKEMLELHNFNCICVENGQEGIEVLTKHDIDMIITDIIMPRMNGIHFIKEVKNMRPELPIIAISGGGKNTAEDYLKSIECLGITRTFEKPFDYTQISLACKDILKQAQ